MLVKKWSTYCQNESIVVEGWKETAPTVCFNNNSHTIDTAQTVLLDVTMASGVVDVRIKQTRNADEPSDRYRAFTYEFSAAPNAVTDYTFQIPIDVNLFSVVLSTYSGNVGDSVTAYINKNTVIGAVVQTATDVTVVNVSQTVSENAEIGLYVNFNGGNDVMVVAVDAIASTVTLESPVTVTVADVVRITYFLVMDKPIVSAKEPSMGRSITGSAFLSKADVGGVSYQNNSSSAKTMMLLLETTF